MTNLVKFDPFAELNALQRKFFGDDWLTPMKAVTIPTTDVYTSDDKQLVIEAHLPNFDEKDIDIHVDDGALVIQAERHEKEEDKDKRYVIRESSSSFYRRIVLPERSSSDDIEAHLENGILIVKVPLTPLPESKHIPVNVRVRENKKHKSKE